MQMADDSASSWLPTQAALTWKPNNCGMHEEMSASFGQTSLTYRSFLTKGRCRSLEFAFKFFTKIFTLDHAVLDQRHQLPVRGDW